ncbi:MAG TPA: peptide chain release factor 1 [Planctomycetaceae bacterium]|jgi:peptide chain release factor 1|nr:peptide chain release factor 1 [Planctomycetaceae bacterium]HAA51373.1 peptide chain release factor 1 [Planctomycetaceae bacterium]|tara:strand:+ start:3960 stop:5036 length:1077 start_codon:yes stop_codon:yes gene_type:complete
MLFPSLQTKLARYEELEKLLVDPDVLSDTNRMVAFQREYGSLAKVALPVREFNELESNIATARELIDEEEDPELKAYAQDELDTLLGDRESKLTALEDLVATGDAISRGSLIMEIRAGTGGDEAALFARDLFEMYQRLVERRGWKAELIDCSPTELGGFKDITISIAGDGAFLQLQFESGGHRVQRVPETETQGRIHTSAATVAVLPEANDVEIEISQDDLRVDTFFASGPGGQKVNKTASAIRITHLPTNTVVQCQDEKSQHKNRAKAMRVLRSRLLEAQQQKAHQERADQRRSLIGTGDRSQRIRTYNFPQNRLTDHRIGLTLYKLDQIMQGHLDEMVEALLDHDRQERLGGNPDA